MVLPYGSKRILPYFFMNVKFTQVAVLSECHISFSCCVSSCAKVCFCHFILEKKGYLC